MRAAILADIHGNSLALENVLQDVDSMGGVDEYWLLGDFAAIGYDPLGVLQRITGLNNARFVRGNTDRYIHTGELPWRPLHEVVHDLSLARTYLQVASSFAWTRGAVGATGWLPWFRELGLDMRLTLPDGTRVLGVHAAPGTDDGVGIHANTSSEELTGLVAGADADLVLVGHTHVPFDHEAGGVRVINPGSISNPFPPDLRAAYAILEADRKGYQVHYRRVEYDRDAVIEAVRQVNHPALDYIERFMKGRNRKDWMK